MNDTLNYLVREIITNLQEYSDYEIDNHKIKFIEKNCDSFDKIFVDEAHHINIPKIYETESNLEDYELERNLEDDDTEDEIKNTTGYNKIIKSLSKCRLQTLKKILIELNINTDEHRKVNLIKLLIDHEYYASDINILKKYQIKI